MSASLDSARALATTLLYEGYALYPYRASALKNRKRFYFGVVEPGGSGHSEGKDLIRTESLVRCGGGTEVTVLVRFLHLQELGRGDAPASQEAVERCLEMNALSVTNLLGRAVTLAFSFAEPAETLGSVVRRSHPIQGRVIVSMVPEGEGVARVAVEVCNDTRLPTGGSDASFESRLPHALLSTHALVSTNGGTFVSLFDPPAELRAAADRCKNVGTWPVLVGEENRVILSSPIILYDHPVVAPESPGDLFDATEIDEILTLRTLTLTDDEKREIEAGDDRVRDLLRRTESLDPATLVRLHGRLTKTARASFQRGDRVVLRPTRRADVFDLALKGRAATVASVEEDLEGGVYLAVTLDDDPGADLGLAGQPGHRFFFRPEEVERQP